MRVAVAVLALVAAGCSQKPAARFEKMAEEFVYTTLAFSPVSATSTGLHEYQGRKLDVQDARDDLEEARRFVREKNIVMLPPRSNLQVIETPEFMRGIYAVGGFNPAPALEPQLGAFHRVTPIPADLPAARVESWQDESFAHCSFARASSAPARRKVRGSDWLSSTIAPCGRGPCRCRSWTGSWPGSRRACNHGGPESVSLRRGSSALGPGFPLAI